MNIAPSYFVIYNSGMFKILSTCKGGGYKYCRTMPAHPKQNSNGLYPLHRVLMENHLGRLLERRENVHHIDGNKNNNEICNLQVLNISEHARIHGEKKGRIVEACCNRCGKVFLLISSQYKARIKRNKANLIFCSSKCSGSYLHNSRFKNR